MNCKHCGNKLVELARYCSFCGVAVSQAHAVAVEPLAALGVRPQRTDWQVWWWPVAAVVVVAAVLGGTTLYERHVDQEVESWRVQAEALALQGNFAAARTLLDDAFAKRPHHLAVQADRTWVEQGQKLQHQLAVAQDEAKQGDFDKALQTIDTASEPIRYGEGPFYELLQKQVRSTKDDLTIAQIKATIKDQSTTSALIVMLNRLTGMNDPSAKSLTDDIRQQIADVAYNQANDLLTHKQFAEAMAAIDQALTYEANDSKLLSFKDTIAKQQAEFEQMEEKRMEEARVSAAKEAEKNRTRAVEVSSVQGSPDSAGDFVIKGEVKNVGTRPISMVEVYYTVFDASGTELKQAATYVYPNYLAPGESGQFADSLYGLGNGAKVTVTNETWYLN